MILKCFDSINIQDKSYWGKLEYNILKQIHIIKPEKFVDFMCITNKNLDSGEPRVSKDYFNKFFTILPVQIEKITTIDCLKICEVMLDQGLRSDRLLNYFIYPKIEKTVFKFKVNNYIYLIKMLIRLNFQVIF